MLPLQGGAQHQAPGQHLQQHQPPPAQHLGQQQPQPNQQGLQQAVPHPPPAKQSAYQPPPQAGGYIHQPYGGYAYALVQPAYRYGPHQPYGRYSDQTHVYTTPPASLPLPHKVLAVDLSQHKQRKDIANKVKRMMGGSTKTFGTPSFHGPLITPPPELHFRQNPCLFRKRLTDAFRIVGIGIIRLEEDAPTAAGAGNVIKAWPNDLTALCFSIVYTMFLTVIAVAAAIARGQDVQVHNLNESMAWRVFQGPFHAYLVSVMEYTRHLLQQHPIDSHALSFHHMRACVVTSARIVTASSSPPWPRIRPTTLTRAVNRRTRPCQRFSPTLSACPRARIPSRAQAKQHGSSLAVLEGKTARVSLPVDRHDLTSDSDADGVNAHVAAVATAGRARKAAEKADYPTLKRTAAATLEKLKKAQLAKRREARVRKSAEQAAEEERQLLARERVLRADLKKELGEEQRRRIETEQRAQAAIAREQASEHQRQQQRAADGEAVAIVLTQLGNLRLENKMLQDQQREMVEIFCPQAASVMAVQQQQHNRNPLLSAKDQLIRTRMEVEQARRELEAASAWGKVAETRNANLNEKNGRVRRRSGRVRRRTGGVRHL
ncbi:unnamed protein product [Ectocarpus sp. CCAP 1310/34]|nr:unnamed protein product [Ectocarpus sp. CCAP 1310/34]